MAGGDGDTLRETALSERLLVLTLGEAGVRTGWGVNCLAFASAAGTLLVDPMIAPAHARRVEEALARRGFPAVRHVVLTHHHPDHALGAGWFAARGAAVIAHRRCAAAMALEHPATLAARRASRDPAIRALFSDAAPFVPAVRFEDRHLLDLGGDPVEVLHLGPGHTAGDAVVLLRGEGTVACGDLVFAGFHFNYEDADAEALPARLRDLAALPATRVVPGHGPVGGPELLDEQARYHREIARIVRSARSRAAARLEIEARFAGWRLPEVVATAVDAFARPAPPEPGQ